MGMKRTLIALAVGAAFAVPAAYADVTLSGSINAGPAWVKSGDGSTNASNGLTNALGANRGATAQQGVTRTGINTNYSNITIGSMEDLGGGLKLDFAYQLTANFQSTSNAATNRNSHIGLVGDSWGGVWIGTNENLYERYYYTVDPLDGAAGIGGNLSIMGTPGYGYVFDAGNGTPSAEFYRRTDHTVWYDSPNWGGFTFGAYTTLGAFKTSSNVVTGAPGINPNIWGIGAKYVGPAIPIQLWAAYEKHKDLFGADAIASSLVGIAPTRLGSSSSDNGIQVGVGYTLGDIFLFGNFERLKYKTDGIALLGGGDLEYKRNAFSIGLKWNVPTGYVGAQYMQALKGKCSGSAIPGCNADQSGAKSLGAGYYHTLSKQTQTYIMGQYIKNDDLNFYTVAGGVGVPVNLGANVYAVTVGLKHSF
jgi:predicted porin